MKLKDDLKRLNRQELWLAIALVAAGVLLGSIARPLEWLKHDADHSMLKDDGPTSDLHHSFLHRSVPDSTSENGLTTLHLDIPQKSAQVLQRVRDKAMERKLIVQEPEDTVKAEVEVDGTRLKADIRIKGDWVDHVKTDKWSYRIKLKGGKLMGMRVFSIQQPATRGYLWEWIVLEAARREGVLAPRCDFVNVVINGNAMGVYYLEEHFSKEMLESQGRREGPIVVLDESTLWSQRLQTHQGMGAALPSPKVLLASHQASTAEVRAFGEKKLEGVAGLQASLDSAVEKMYALQNLLIASDRAASRSRAYARLDSLQGATIEEIFNTDMVARWHALASVFKASHGIVWHNMRFYYDPVMDRLEPVMFDNMAHAGTYHDITMFMPNRPIVAEFRKSPHYYTEVFRDLSVFTRAEWLNDLFDDLRPQIDLYYAALEAEFKMDPRHHPDAIKQVYRAQQIFLKESLYPRDPVNFACNWEAEEHDGNMVSGTVQVRAWATTASPVVLEGFRFSNDTFVPAVTCIPDHDPPLMREGRNGVVLPLDLSPRTFVFSLDERLANLENIQQIKRAIQNKTQDTDDSLDLNVRAVFRPIAAGTSTEELLRLRRRPAADQRGGRPRLPSLQEALERYACLKYDSKRERLGLRAGTWDLDGDLLVPSGMTLHAGGGVHLRFGQDAVLLTDSPLEWNGNAEHPVILEPQEGLPSWSGIVVLGAAGTSHWRHVIVRKTDRLQRGGWATTGGITFYHSPVEMVDCRIESTVAEDGLNIFGCETLLDGVVLTGCISDSFDGDFITGTIRNCRFEDGQADGLDVSGSDILVENCTFVNLQDKGISVGENSKVRVRGGLMDNVVMGVVSKDLSETVVTGLEIRSARRYALAAYIKKPEFGPASIVADSLIVGQFDLGLALVQTGSSITVDGQSMAVVDLDVKALYEEGILGN